VLLSATLFQLWALFDHLVGARKEGRRDGETKCFGHASGNINECATAVRRAKAQTSSHPAASALTPVAPGSSLTTPVLLPGDLEGSLARLTWQQNYTGVRVQIQRYLDTTHPVGSMKGAEPFVQSSIDTTPQPAL
jgi:hypothetical protein